MRTETAPQPVFLANYRPPSHWIDTVDLRLDLHDDHAVVCNRMRVRRNPDPKAASGPLRLDGEGLRLRSVAIDGRALRADEFNAMDGALELLLPLEGTHEIEIVTECEPQKNLSFEGLYRSSGMYCTQCEAEGFRRITYFLDRPDVMSVYRVTIEADEVGFPILLSNGNLIAKRSLEGGRHEATWEDPFPKPCYLFAAVAGDLGLLEDQFIRRSGKPVRLQIFCAKGLENRCKHAMESLKRAMKWDEDVYGLEYDLDVYMIVVAHDFNMGAMENKGLNVFNSNYVLAREETATDTDFDGIQAVVAHEYFHNWTGNRVTCRDWFQLSLKEGLTVFRDQEFSSDMGSRAVKRIEDVSKLRTLQFAEDAGPLSHPVRPQSYITINNFYTKTIYEKGAEVIRMIHAIVGSEGFRRGTDKYFELFDGKAVTTEDFVHAMELASGIDLSQFKRWYDQAGTPVVRAALSDVGANGATLSISQSCPPTPGQPNKEPFHVPFAIGMVGADGRDVPIALDGEPLSAARTTRVLHVREREQTFRLHGNFLGAAPSFLRGFSAPVKLEYAYANTDLVRLMRSDSDPFARWEAAQTLALREAKLLVAERSAGRPAQPSTDVVDAFAEVVKQAHGSGSGAIDPAFAALMLLLPIEQFMAQQFEIIDPVAIHGAREALRKAIAVRAKDDFEALYRALHMPSREGRDRVAIGRRALKNRALDYLCTLDEPTYLRLAAEQIESAHNMTDELAALSALSKRAGPERERALGAFYAKWKREPLVMDKWLSIQAVSPAPDAVERVRRLTADPVFDKTNPNRVSHLFGHFAMMNLMRFHEADGAGYRLIADQVLDIDARNPQVAARLMSAFNIWKRIEPSRRSLMRSEIERVAKTAGISSDVYEIASKALGL